MSYIRQGIGLSVPANFSSEFIRGLEKLLLDKKGNDYIDNVYGAPRGYVSIGQARSSKKIRQLSKSELKMYIDSLHSLDINFHFTINSIWSDAMERNSNNVEIILAEIEELIELGVDALIIGNVYLAELINKTFKNINTICSINLKTDSFYKLTSYVSEFKFNKVVLDRTVNRNVSFLKKLLKKYESEIVLLANPDCVYDCPISQYHMLESSYLSMDKVELENKRYCVNFCTKKYNDDFSELLKTPWIHPADMELYENIGLRYLKIQGRTLSIDRILFLIKSYLNRLNTEGFYEIFPNFIGASKKKEELAYLNNQFFNRAEFVKTFFDFDIRCKEECGAVCTKCDEIILNLKGN